MDQHTKTGNKRKDENTQKKKWKCDFKNDIFAIKKIPVHSLMSSEKNRVTNVMGDVFEYLNTWISSNDKTVRTADH